MVRPRAVHRAFAAALSIAIAAAAADARAELDDLMIFIYVGNVIPAGIGPTVPIGPNATDRVGSVVAWPVQLPFDGGGLRNPFDPGSFHHRIVIAPELVARTKRATDPAVGDLYFRVRGGYRYVAPVIGRLSALAGLGSTLDAAPVVRPSVSPELGLRYDIGDASDFFRYATLIARGDVWAAGANDKEASVLLGWCFF